MTPSSIFVNSVDEVAGGAPPSDLLRKSSAKLAGWVTSDWTGR
ncbi:hypothetical protein [Deinococcus aestuarii]|nr:hypothetical protein [Deinococcus aestuarii]